MFPIAQLPMPSSLPAAAYIALRFSANLDL